MVKTLEAISSGGDVAHEERETDKYLASLVRPKMLTGKYTDEVRYEHSFEANCIVLSKFINQPVKSLTTKEYFALIEHYNQWANKNR